MLFFGKEDLWIAIILIALFALLYVLILPIAMWMIEMRAYRLLAYLASGMFCFVIVYICVQAVPDLATALKRQQLVQYFACFGLLLGGGRLIGAYGKSRKHAAMNRNRQPGR